MSFDFIHIGLGKCMSTTLQTLWARSNNTHNESGEPIVKAVNSLIIEHQADLGLLPAIDLDVPSVQVEVSVLSSESFSFSFLNQPQFASLIAPKHAYIAQVLSGMSKHVLIIVRDPVSWVRSAHAQSINQGGFDCASDFVHTCREVILSNLNLRRLFGVWAKAGFELVVLPMELFIQDEASFWEEYERGLSVEAPDNRADIQGIGRNASAHDQLALAAHINRIQHTLSLLVDRGRAPDKGVIMAGLETARLWGARRGLPEASDAERAALAVSVGFTESAEFSAFDLDGAFLDVLSRDFLAPLAEMPAMSSVLDAYGASIATLR